MTERLLTSPCPRGGRRAPKERDGRGATPAAAMAYAFLLYQIKIVVPLPAAAALSIVCD